MFYWPSWRRMWASIRARISISLRILRPKQCACSPKKRSTASAAPPDAQELREKKIGHVFINSMMDKPWSQYFCCMVATNQQFVRKNPVAATKSTAGDLESNRSLCPRAGAGCSISSG